jgi:branched-chain amino acid transport system substrate-binding protein
MNFAKNLTLIAAAFASGSAYAQYTDGMIKIGVLSDMSSLYADQSGVGSIVATKLAVADSGVEIRGMKVEVVAADNQNKPELGLSIASSWFDVDKVDVIVGGGSSGVALAASEVARRKNKVLLVSEAATSDLTGQKCNANTIHWVHDTWNLANGTGKAVVKGGGGDTWFFLTADYTFGYTLERETTEVVEANGGKVVGKVRHPLNSNDFSSFLLQAQASRAKIIGLANAGGDTINAIKQGGEFGLVRGQRFAGLLMYVSDIATLGLAATQGMVLTETWYWDMNDANRSWTKRWQTERPGSFLPGSKPASIRPSSTISKLSRHSGPTVTARRWSLK